MYGKEPILNFSFIFVKQRNAGDEVLYTGLVTMQELDAPKE